ncbi:hypothetical protein N0V82_003400 [Gnomoniopsis sp. IMI 355080]|nr:hypothetical protein N0V82_003400 [Gnomoniopsis sp. IMI 355080]
MLPAVPFAQPRLLQSAQQSNPTPAMDPETLPATQGLNEWGAFTGGSKSSNSGTFGLGPLLFRHGGVEETETATKRGASPPLSGRDLVEMDRLLRNDPVSFNPMQAISWAKLNEDAVEKATPPQREKELRVRGQGNAASLRKGVSEAEYEQGVSSPGPSERSRQSGRDGHAMYSTTTTKDTSSSTSTSKDIEQRYSENTKPAPSLVGNMARTFSNMDVAGSNGHGVFVPPGAFSSLSTTHRIDSVQPQVRQQRKHRHRQEKRAGPTRADTYTQQASGYQQSSFPTSSTLVSIPEQPMPAQYQMAYTNYSTESPSNQPSQQPAPPLRQDTGPLPCLAPLCHARFPSEAQRNSHYQTDHAVGPLNNNDGRRPPYPSSDNLICSWPSCGAGRFTSENALMWHVKAEHLLSCPVPQCCNRVFPSRKQVDAHVRNRFA